MSAQEERQYSTTVVSSNQKEHSSPRSSVGHDDMFILQHLDDAARTQAVV
jgi:hypothetical protein